MHIYIYIYMVFTTERFYTHITHIIHTYISTYFYEMDFYMETILSVFPSATCVIVRYSLYHFGYYFIIWVIILLVTGNNKCNINALMKKASYDSIISYHHIIYFSSYNLHILQKHTNILHKSFSNFK